ncbi:hypothetical protein ACOTTU_19250 [Roseobacter sp. EG26]|uniref:hypothetical protein n=1 Tax=Roseobacter sp. EG26 TaxID=3412477 RepID=UPI003CE52216
MKKQVTERNADTKLQTLDINVPGETIGHCSICERDLPTPCVPLKAISPNDLIPTQDLIIPEGDVIRAKTKEAVLQKGFFCEMGRWLAKKNLMLPEIRWMVAYTLYGGLEKGMSFQKPCGRPYVIEPETIDEVFDGRKTLHLPVTSDWNDEPVSYDRAIRDWLDRSIAGQITGKPDSRWGERLVMLDITRRVLNSKRFNDA